MRLRTILAVLALSCSLVSLAEAKKPTQPTPAAYKKALAKARKNANKKQKKVKLVNKGKVVKRTARKK